MKELNFKEVYNLKEGYYGLEENKRTKILTKKKTYIYKKKIIYLSFDLNLTLRMVE